MKKLFVFGPIWLCVLFAVLPCVGVYGRFQIASAGFALELYEPLITYAVLVIIELIVYAGIYLLKIKLGETSQISTAVLLPLTLIWAGCFGEYLAKWEYSFGVFILLIIISISASGVMMFHEVQEKGVKIAFTITTMVIGSGVGIWLFLCLLLGDFGVTRVMHSKPSPEGKYVAEIIDYDEGALGGSTTVEVRRTEAISFFIGRISKNPIILCHRGWGLWDEIEFEWVDEDTLLIDGTEYTNDGEW